MSREIKFRVWNPSQKSMSIVPKCDYLVFHGLVYDRIDCNSLKNVWMQLAPSKDFYSNDIFVGDILSDRWKVEVYQNDEGTFMVKFHTNPKGNKPRSLKSYLTQRLKAGTAICEGYRDCLVIGNIYENPELLSS